MLQPGSCLIKFYRVCLFGQIFSFLLTQEVLDALSVCTTRVKVVDMSGCSSTHRYFLTGGIDYLLDTRSDTRVFHAVVGT